MNDEIYHSFYSKMCRQYHQDPDSNLQFYNALLDAQLFLLLHEEAQEETLSPQTQDIESSTYVLVFDNEAKLVDFCGDVAPYAAVTGRVLIEMLAGQDTGLAFNPNAYGSETLLSKDIVDWLSEMTSQAPKLSTAKPKTFFPLGPKVEKTAVMLHEKLANSAYLAQNFYLCGVEYEDASCGILLAITGANDSSEKALAKAAHEAFVFGGSKKMVFDVVFLEENDKALAAIKRQSLQLQFKQKKVETRTQRPNPGGDPYRPPKLL